VSALVRRNLISQFRIELEYDWLFKTAPKTLWF
jgi:hypothetical protein